jgi:hypothetical protein
VPKHKRFYATIRCYEKVQIKLYKPLERMNAQGSFSESFDTFAIFLDAQSIKVTDLVLLSNRDWLSEKVILSVRND